MSNKGRFLVFDPESGTYWTGSKWSKKQERGRRFVSKNHAWPVIKGMRRYGKREPVLKTVPPEKEPRE